MFCIGPMPNGLSVAADGANLVRGKPRNNFV